MTSAIERLATELANISADEWTRVAERRIAGQDWNAVFGQAWDEISERVVQREPTQETAADQAHDEAGALPRAVVRSRNQT